MIYKYIIHLWSEGWVLILQSGIFLILNGLDGYSTWLVLKPDHYERERNPVARLFFRLFKLPAAIVFFKAILLSGLGVFIACYSREALTINTALGIGNLLFFCVVLHNFKVHRRYTKQQGFWDRIKYVQVD